MTISEKRVFLKQFVKSEEAVEELLIYCENKFVSQNQVQDYSQNNEFVKTWENYYCESQEIGVFKTLKKYLVQFQFPVEENISKTLDYKNVTLRGKPKQSKTNLELNQPDQITLEIYDKPVIGKVPVITVSNNKDFNTVICALSNKNEPKKIPSSMGASFIKGINNWDRIGRLKSTWLNENSSSTWNKFFKENIIPKPYLYKDNLIVLSTKKYSGIESIHIGVSENNWKNLSLIIRREHECAHLFTLQYYGCMANNIHDEIIADYAGITKATDRFNKEWFLYLYGIRKLP